MDPYMATVSQTQGDELTYARRVELLRAIHEQRQQLEAKEALVEELKRRNDRLQVELADSLDPETTKALRTRVAVASTQLSNQAEELETAQGHVRLLEGQVKSMTDLIAEEKNRNADLVMEQNNVRRRLESEISTRANVESARVGLQLDKSKAEQLQEKLAQAKQQAEDDRVQAEKRCE